MLVVVVVVVMMHAVVGEERGVGKEEGRSG